MNTLCLVLDSIMEHKHSSNAEGFRSVIARGYFLSNLRTTRPEQEAGEKEDDADENSEKSMNSLCELVLGNVYVVIQLMSLVS